MVPPEIGSSVMKKFLQGLVALALLVSSHAAIAQGVRQGEVAGRNGIIVYGKLADGTYAPLPLDEDGKLDTNASLSGGGDASAANQETLNTAFGTAASTVCPTSTGSCDAMAILKKIADWMEDQVGLMATPAAIDQTTPGTTNGVQDASTGATASAVPAKASYAGANSGGNLVGIIQADNHATIDMSTATTTQIIALSSGKKTYITHLDFMAGGTTNFKLVRGTGTNCGTGTADLTKSYPLTAQSGAALGTGLGPIIFVPSGEAVCATNSAAQQVTGLISYTQF